ncbi:membrane protein YfhO [Tistlia consotensis]|uniref:Membrane protein YfhO n=1 Tax=Tistlia consotensis USBA 355 TaxID=560819 RepID=A0A1Y6B8S9_9PROT|nr:YfhO family protein [Tistlia consotensis]SME98877.1 membrane protein YfhO [Tistlia consotensis USBA 355]SNR58335.1 membrane protein YfhO [Tistlia consotensis]
MTRRFAPIVLEWLLVATGSMLVMALVYPDLLVTAQVRFTAGHDSMIPYQSAWVQAGYLLRGGMQLWNRFDQVNHAYLHLSTGFQGLTPIVEGWLFSLFGGGLARPGEAFQHFHPVAFNVLATLFRTAGGLALLGLYPVPRWARVLALLLANTLLATQAYDGMMAGFLYSLTPLVLYLLILFFRRVSPATLLWAVLGLGFAFAQMPLVAVGYFYLPIHLFAVCCLLAFGWWAFRARRVGEARPAVAAPALRGPAGLALALGCGAFAVILAMDLDYLGLLKSTFYLTGSGLGGTHGRFDQLFSPFAYLAGRYNGPDLAPLASEVLDFTVNRWWLSWQLIGAASLGLSLIGLTHGRHRERWLYAAAFGLTILSQLPRQELAGLPAHLVIAFTDPFAFLIRSSQMSTMLIGYFLIVPTGLGLATLWRRAQETEVSRKGWLADAVATAVLLAGAVFAATALPTAAAIESAAVFAGLTLCLLAPRIGPLRVGVRPRALAVALPLAAVAADLWGYSLYLERVPYTGDRIQPRSFEGLEASDGRQINPVVIDYQNPATLAFPRHVRVAPYPVTPSTDPGFFVIDYAVYFVDQCYIGAYFDTVFLNREFKHPNLYELRHRSYAAASEKIVGEADWRDREQKALYPLLKADDRALFFAPVAVAADKVGPAELVAADAGRWAVSLEDPAGGKVPSVQEALPAAAPVLPPQPEEQRDFDLTVGDAVARRPRAPGLATAGGFVEYDFPLPKGFPAYMATNLFTADRDSIRLWLDGQELAPAQGYLIRPFTFDVRNVATDRLVVALPADQPPGSRLLLSVTIDGLLKDVRPNRNDVTGLEVQAPADGWLVWRAPYDDGWQATLDGEPVPVYIADRTAMAVRVPAGRHKVVFAYRSAASDAWTRRLVEAHLFASPLLGLLMIALCLWGTSAGFGWSNREERR